MVTDEELVLLHVAFISNDVDFAYKFYRHLLSMMLGQSTGSVDAIKLAVNSTFIFELIAWFAYLKYAKHAMVIEFIKPYSIVMVEYIKPSIDQNFVKVKMIAR